MSKQTHKKSLYGYFGKSGNAPWSELQNLSTKNEVSFIYGRLIYQLILKMRVSFWEQKKLISFICNAKGPHNFWTISKKNGHCELKNSRQKLK
jgi:hypothetical protein